MSRRSLAILLVTTLWATVALSGEAVRPDPTTEVDEGPRTVLRWKARSEQGVYGYLVYRANSEDAPYRRVNSEIIHSRASELDEPSEYRFVDRDVEAGRTYFYYLDTIGNDGKKTRFSNVISKTVDDP